MRRPSLSTLLVALAALTVGFTAAGVLASDAVDPAQAQEAAPATASTPHGSLVISQVYGGGGNTGSATFRHDYVELFNRGDQPVSTANMSIHYASATGTGHFVRSVLPAATIAPGARYLVQGGSGGSNTGASLPSPDATMGHNLHHESGKVLLATGTAAIECNGASTPCGEIAQSRFVDLVGYGSANFAEGQPAPRLSNTTAAVRAGGGCEDSGDNRADFSATTPEPRNSGAAPEPCEVAPGEAQVPADPTPATPDDTPVEDEAPTTETPPAAEAPTAELDDDAAEGAVTQLEAQLEELVEAMEDAQAPADVGMAIAEMVAAGDLLNHVTATSPAAAEVASDRHPGCNGIEVAVTKVQPRSNAKQVLDERARTWNCTRAG